MREVKEAGGTGAQASEESLSQTSHLCMISRFDGSDAEPVKPVPRLS